MERTLVDYFSKIAIDTLENHPTTKHPRMMNDIEQTSIKIHSW